MKEIIKNLLEKYSASVLPFIFGAILVMLVSFSFSYFNSAYKRATLTETVVSEPKRRLSTEKSKNFIKCIYEQLECYRANIGIEKSIVLEACKDLDYCEDEKGKTK
jgi:hypothetical protein